MISEDKAACLMYHRIPFKDKSKGYLLCRIVSADDYWRGYSMLRGYANQTNSRVGQHIIGACAPAKSSTKNMHTASTAQETVVITPSAKRLAFTVCCDSVVEKSTHVYRQALERSSDAYLFV